MPQHENIPGSNPVQSDETDLSDESLDQVTGGKDHNNHGHGQGQGQGKGKNKNDPVLPILPVLEGDGSVRNISDGTSNTLIIGES